MRLKRYKTVLFLLLSISIVIIGILIMLKLQNVTSEKEIVFIDNTYSEDIKERLLSIDIQGAVKKAGVYQLERGSIVEDVITLAGGLKSSADADYIEKNINRAKQLSDGEKIYIPYKGETKEGTETQKPGREDAGKININTASVQQLDSLPGIGPSYAAKIIDGRPYVSIDDIKKVSGIGESTFEKIKELITI